MKTALIIFAACLVAVMVLVQIPQPTAERSSQATSDAGIDLRTDVDSDATERRTPVRRESNAASTSVTNKPVPASLAALPPTEQRSLEEQMRAAQRWFAHAGNSSNGTPRLVASVRGQKFDFIAEDNGVSVRPWSGATNWSWRMASGDAVNVAPKAEKERATYARGAGVTEWFENGERGVEQGFTLETVNGEAVRRMPLRVATELQPKLRPQADGVDFLDAKGDAQLHYDGLHAFDAEGKKLKSWMEVSTERGASLGFGSSTQTVPSNAQRSLAHQLTLAVDTTGAKFPVTIDPVISLAAERIDHPEPVPGDLFGVTVAAYGNLIAIGAPRHSASSVSDAGVVYLFRRGADCDEEWELMQKIESPNPYNPGFFGRTLAMGNGVLAIAAHRLTASGGGGDVLEDVVQVYQPSPTNSSVWTRRVALKDPDPNATFNPTNFFGYSLSINSDGSQLAIGSPLAWSEGGQFPFKTGKVFLHGRDTGGVESWGFIRTFQPPLFVPNARFGRSVALDGDQLAVGAPGYFTTSTNGSAFVFERDPGPSWQLAREFAAPTLSGAWILKGFGERIALSGNHLAVAAPEADLLYRNAGAVVVYERRTSYDPGFGGTLKVWFHGILYPPGLEPFLSNPNPPQAPFELSKLFGRVLSLDGGTLVAGWRVSLLPFDPWGKVSGLNTLVRYEHQGHVSPDVALNWKREAVTPVEAFNLDGIANAIISGSLLVVTSTNENLGGTNFNFGVGVAMRRLNGTWAATQRFVAGLPLASHDLAGTSLAVSDDLLVVGAPGYDVGGEADSGAVHVFRRLPGVTNASSVAHGWTLAATLVNDTPQANGRLGESVAVSGDLVVAGAPGRNNAGGTVWIWKRTSEAADVWAGHVVLGAPSGLPGWKFGSAVSFNGSTIAVGSPFAGAGRAHLFRRGTTNDWPVLQTLLPHANDGRFGAALDLDEDDNLIVGAPDASVNGAQSGEAYIYRRTETASGPEWVQEADPGSFVAGGHAGTSVAIDRGWAFVGAPGEVIDSGRSGRVRVFRRNHTTGDPWEGVATLEPPASLNSIEKFGSAIALDEHNAVIGAPGGTASGSAFVYSRVHGGAGAWRYTAKLLDPCHEAGDGFGSSIALDHDKIFVGSPKADILSAGNAGTVTLFERQGTTWTLQREVPEDSTHRIGSSVAVSGDWMVIGSTRDWDNDVEGVSDAGQVYVLRRHDGANGAWNVVQRVVRPLLPGGIFHGNEDDFGLAVDISDRVFVVGSEAGVHTFELATDGQVTHLGPLPPGMNDVDFGRAVAIHGQHIAVTATGSTTPGERGSVAFFVRTNEHPEPFGQIIIQTSWHREKRIGSSSFDFGAAVDISDTTAVVGAPGDYDFGGARPGQVYLFERDRGGLGNWGSTGSIAGPNLSAEEGSFTQFGASVSLDGDTLAVGYAGQAEEEYYQGGGGCVFQRHAGGFNHWGKVASIGGGPSMAVSGDWVLGGAYQPYQTGASGNVIYPPAVVTLHHRNAGGPDQWGVVQTFTAPNTNRTHTWNFGHAVALDGTTLVIGAPGEKRTAIDWTPGRAFIYDVPLNSLQIWKDTLFAEEYFTGPITPYSGQATGNLGDLDNDGVPNSWEAYHGLNPLVVDAALAGLKAQGLNLATGEFVLRWREALDPQGLSVTLQWSRNLGQWFNSGAGPSVGDTKTFAITTVETNADHVIKEARVPAGGDARLFTRFVLLGP